MKVYNFTKQFLAGGLGLDGPAGGALVDEENNGQEPLIGEGNEQADNLSFIAGTILAIEGDRLKKLVFRVTQGKAACYFSQFTQDGVERLAYIVMYSNNAQDRLRV